MASSANPTKATFAQGTELFVSLLAVVYAIAFASFWYQAAGLVGRSGILPASQLFPLARQQFGIRALYYYPSLSWIFGGGIALPIFCALGLVLSLLLFLRLAPALCLLLLWAGYLSVATAGQDFYEFQWDSLLLEATLIAICAVPWRLRPSPSPYNPPPLARYLIWWLLFRLMFLSGAVKLTSGDPTWRHLTALAFHFQTQPLPTPLGWYAHQLPARVQQAGCALVLVIELLAPFGLLGPRRVRHGAIAVLILLQVVIALTGNYAFFNLLTIALCLPALDDDWWRSVRWGVAVPVQESRHRLHLTLVRWFAAISVGITFFESFADLSRGAAQSPLVRLVAMAVEPSRSFNVYGLFRVMTIKRPELVFEGSDDGHDWREYTLPFKPGNLAEPPHWVAPYQPRLDWQLWFAALSTGPDSAPWVYNVCERLLQGDHSVLGLFAHNPFPNYPPKYIRVLRYNYEFTTPAERRRTGHWWKRELGDMYISPLSLPADKS